MPRNSQKARRSPEDATSQGGWLFADSFLALMVIFLATISFVPALSNSRAPEDAIGSANNYKEAFVMVFDSYDPLLLQQEIAKFIETEELPSTARVLYGEFLGGYDQATETVNDGNLRGLAFAVQVKREGIPAFRSSTINAGATPSVKPTQVLIRLTFASR